MILDMQRFVRDGQAQWDELERMLRRLENDPSAGLTLEDAKRFHLLYQQASADLARVMTFSSEPAIRSHLESLVGRAYGEIHRQRKGSVRWSPLRWFLGTFPRTFRRHGGAFLWSCLITIAGTIFGGAAVLLDPEAKAALMPFEHLQGDPTERVQREEREGAASGAAAYATFSSELMTHNTKVAVFALSLGMTWGFGTMALLFYNGVILGAVVLDYVVSGQSLFLAGWLLPHGSIEIPAILIAGQAGLVLGRALIGWADHRDLRERLRVVGPDLATLIGGVAIMLVWAGIVESFFSQFHAPVVPYPVKVAVGLAELCLLVAFLGFCGRNRREVAS